MTTNIEVRELRQSKGSTCESILRSLPRWFGIEEAIVGYVKAVEKLPTYVAITGETVAGFVSIESLNSSTSEIHVMAVREEFHRHGVGRALVEKSEEVAHSQGAEFLMVKTLGPSRKDENYDRTREFYLGVGFRPIEEFRTIWNEFNPCLLMIKSLLSPVRSNNTVLDGLDSVLLFVKDVEQSKGWYQKVLGTTPSINIPGFVEFRIGQSALGLHPADAKSPLTAGGQMAYWSVDDFEKAVDHFVSLGGQLYRGPLEIEDGRFICQILDPFGNAVGLIGRKLKIGVL